MHELMFFILMYPYLRFACFLTVLPSSTLGGGPILPILFIVLWLATQCQHLWINTSWQRPHMLAQKWKYVAQVYPKVMQFTLRVYLARLGIIPFPRFPYDPACPWAQKLHLHRSPVTKRHAATCRRTVSPKSLGNNKDSFPLFMWWWQRS